MAASVYLVAGQTRAGKTTHAIELAARVRGIRFSIDDWMTTLFWMDSPQPIEFEWTMARVGRCEAQILDQVKDLSKMGVPSVLDLGFTRSDHRARFAAEAQAMGATVGLHWLDISADARWQRVQQRNREKGETFTMTVDRNMFDFMEGQWQPPSDDELTLMNGQILR